MALQKRIKWVMLIILLSVVPTAGQSTNEFRQKYGSPDNKGRYIARPGVALKVSFAANGQVCRILIEPESSVVLGNSALPLMKLEAVTEIIGELVPEVRRDQRRPILTMSGGCTSVEEYNYEQVIVHRTNICKAEGGKGVSVADILWKTRNCK